MPTRSQAHPSSADGARANRSIKAYVMAIGVVFVIELVVALSVSPTGGHILEALGMGHVPPTANGI